MVVALATGSLGCGATVPSATERPALSVAPTATPTITQRPTVPAGLVVTGEDAPRNIPDPCALLTIAEATELLGGVPVGATREIGGGDSWVCRMAGGPRDESLLIVAVAVNGATPGWMEEFRDAGATQAGPTTVIATELGSVVTELGLHLLVVAVGDAAAPRADLDPVFDVVAAVVARTGSGD